MEDPENECPICFEKFDGVPKVQVHCCRKTMHLSCYTKCSPMCPFCRSRIPVVGPVHIIVTDWPRVTKSVFVSVMIGACLTTSMLLNFGCQ